MRLLPGGRTDAPREPADEALFDVASRALAWAADREYTGWDYADGMSSRVRRALPADNRWVNLAFQEVAKRAPVNIRPLLLVEQRRSFMGAALFALAHHNLAAYCRATGTDPRLDHRAAETELLEWLVEERCRGYAGFCGGHRHQNQKLDHRTHPDEPDVVSTSFAVRALLAGGDRFADRARTAADFLLEDMHYRSVPGGAKVDYYPKDDGDHYTLNAGALAARTLLDLHDRFDEPALCDRATALLDFVAACQTDVGGWYYREPPEASHLSMDTHHNGFVVECLQRHHAVTGGRRYADELDAALPFFRETLFEPDGAPNFDEDSAYPRDVHAAAQGVLVFSYDGDRARAARVAGWVLDNLWDGSRRFYFRRERFYTRRVTLMRWCQAWMTYALSVFLRTGVEEE